MNAADVLDAVKEDHVRFIDLWFTDITGIVKSMTIPAGQLARALESGTHFDGSSIDGFARVAESDMVLLPDPNTFALLPWEYNGSRSARLICAIHTPQGEPFIGCPRGALIRALRQAETRGYHFKTGIEMEFFLFRTDAAGRPISTAPTDQSSYFDLPAPDSHAVIREMLTTLAQMGIRVDSAHSEIGFGQHEIDFHYNAALTSADQLLTARVVLKTIARQHNLHATLMPRPSAELPGSGMHTHQTLHDIHTDENVFVDTTHEYGLSEVARYFLAGQLCHARAMTAVLAPLVNSYKRLGTSFEAPIYVSWAHINRGALIRVPSTSAGMEAHTRLELRCPDPSSNPYLASAVMLSAGLDGIEHQMPLAAPMEETLLTQQRGRLRQVETLPATLGEALEALTNDDVLLGALGPYISDRYLAAKRQEFDEYNHHVTQWEIDRYLGRY